MPANNVAGDPNQPPPPAGPTLRFVIELDDMDQRLQAINQAAFRQRGIKMQVVPTIGLIATRPIDNWPADWPHYRMFPHHFALSPELDWLGAILTESDCVIPAPFIVEMKYSLSGTGKAGLAEASSDRPETALAGATLTPGIRDLIAREQENLLPRLAELRRRFAAGDYGAASREQSLSNDRSRQRNKGEVLGRYPRPDQPEKRLCLAQSLPRELGPCFMLEREYRN